MSKDTTTPQATKPEHDSLAFTLDGAVPAEWAGWHNAAIVKGYTGREFLQAAAIESYTLTGDPEDCERIETMSNCLEPEYSSVTDRCRDHAVILGYAMAKTEAAAVDGPEAWFRAALAFAGFQLNDFAKEGQE